MTASWAWPAASLAEACIECCGRGWLAGNEGVPMLVMNPVMNPEPFWVHICSRCSGSGKERA